jgi:hypothetical protein
VTSDTLDALIGAKAAAIDQMNALISRWKTFGLEQHIIDIADRCLSPSQANEFIGLVRSDLVALDMDNQLAALAATLDKI